MMLSAGGFADAGVHRVQIAMIEVIVGEVQVLADRVDFAKWDDKHLFPEAPNIKGNKKFPNPPIMIIAGGAGSRARSSRARISGIPTIT